jgi:MoaA/NifB/PqqE/SkfB family radical SAM enzyme
MLKAQMPLTVVVSLTPRCNLQCIMCEYWRNPPTSNEILSLEEIKKIIDQARQWGVKSFGLDGGEPFLRKDIFDIIQYALSKKIETCIVSNAILIDRKVAKRIIASGLKTLAVSLDGANAQTHDFIRGKAGTFDKLIRAVSYLRHSPVQVCANTVIMEENFSELLSIALLSRKVGIVCNNYQAKLDSNAKPEIFAGKKYRNINILKKEIESIGKARDIIGGILTPQQFLNSIITYFQDRSLLKPRSCQAGIYDLRINHRGEVKFCSHAVGNIKEDPLEIIWNSARAKLARLKCQKCLTPCLTACSFSAQDYRDMKRRGYFLESKI